MALSTVTYLTYIDTKLNKKLYIICKDLKDAWNKRTNLLSKNPTRYKYVNIRKSKPNKEYNKI